MLGEDQSRIILDRALDASKADETEALLKVASDFPGLEAHTLTGRGEGPEPGVRYVLRWETLPANRDRPREQAPPPSELRLYELRLE